MRCTCCLFMLTLWSAAAGCNNRMPMCIGSFSLHSKWIGLSKRYPNSSVLRRDVESDRLIGNLVYVSVFPWTVVSHLSACRMCVSRFSLGRSSCSTSVCVWTKRLHLFVLTDVGKHSNLTSLDTRLLSAHSQFCSPKPFNTQDSSNRLSF